MRHHTASPVAASRPLDSLIEGAKAVLECSNADEKAALAREIARQWKGGCLRPPSSGDDHLLMPARPARPAHPLLLSHRDMPRRNFRGPKGRFALLHSLAHIELNAIDLAFDIMGRFGGCDLPLAFFNDWMNVGDDEARHFMMLQQRLRALDGAYGDMPAHDGLWEAAEETSHDLLARLAIVPLVLEARGLDVTPNMIERMTDAGDTDNAAVLSIIYQEEKQHVAAGMRWFNYICEQRGLQPSTTFQSLVRIHFRGALKQPFNFNAREEAGMPRYFYEDLSKR